LQDWDDAQDLDHVVHDNRDSKRAAPAKSRRNRRYENRLLKSQINGAETLIDGSTWNSAHTLEFRASDQILITLEEGTQSLKMG
jgi:hypothetical protein